MENKTQIKHEEEKKDSDKNIDEKKEHTHKAEDKKEKHQEKKIKKENAVTIGRNLHISKKHGMYLCAFIKNKKIDDAIGDLNMVLKYKKAVPFKGEIPHRKGRGMMSGRYPVKATAIFINLLKTLKGNSIVNGLDIEKTTIFSAFSNWGSRPLRKGSVRGKRTNIVLEAKEIIGGKN